MPFQLRLYDGTTSKLAMYSISPETPVQRILVMVLNHRLYTAVSLAKLLTGSSQKVNKHQTGHQHLHRRRKRSDE